MGYELDVTLVHLVGLEQFEEGIVGKGEVSLGRHQPDALGHAFHMSVDRHERHPEREEQHH